MSMKGDIRYGGFANPAFGAKAVAPSSTDTFECRYLYVGGAGDVEVEMFDKSVVTFKAVPAGTVLPVVATKLLLATTATNVVAMS